MDNKGTGVDLGHAPLEGTGAQKKPVPVDGQKTVVGEQLPVVQTSGADRVNPDDLAAALAGGEKSESAEKVFDTEHTPGKIDVKIDRMVKATLGEMDLHINQLMMGPRDIRYVSDKLHKLYPTEKDQEKAKEDPTSMFNLLLGAFRDGWGTNQQMSILDILRSALSDKNSQEVLRKQSDEEMKSFHDGTTHKMHTSGVDLTGVEARDAFMTAAAGLKKVKLLNSGFWVTIRRPIIHELQKIYECVDLELKEVGYSIGAHSCLLADFYIRQRFCDALIKFQIIRDSNLKGIFNEDTFIRALAISDYEVLIQAVLSLMTIPTEGIRARVICPECHTETILDHIDISSCKYLNLNLITPEMREWWDKKTDDKGNPIGKRTLDDLEHYRKDILGFKGSFIEKFDAARIKLYLHEPTMFEYFEVGKILIRKIQETIDDMTIDDNERRQMILMQVGAHSYHMISPWIEKIELLGEGDQVVNRTSDTQTILNMLDLSTQNNSAKPLIELAKFVANVKITYIGLYSLECPNCHAKPDVGQDQFYPLEVQTIFFGQMFRLLPAELMPTGL